MSNWKKYIWTIPIIGAIITFISMAVPAITSATLTSDLYGPAPWDMNFWMIGYFEFGSDSGGINELADLTGGLISLEMAVFIICFIGLLIGAILAVGSGVLGYRGNFRKSIALIGGVLMVAFSITLIIYGEADMSLFSGDSIIVPGPDIMTYKFNVGFGIIGPIIGGVLCITSIFMDRIPVKERIEPETPKQPQVKAEPRVAPSSEARFCPHCGTEVPGEFCPDCGKPFQPLIAQ